MSQEFNIVGNLLLKVDGAEAGLNKLKNSLSKLEIPKGLENSFKKSFSNLDDIFARYKKQLEKGFESKADVSNITKIGKELDSELTKVSNHLTKLTGEKIDFKIDTAPVKQATKDLEEILEKRKQLVQEKLEFKIDSPKEGIDNIKQLLEEFQRVMGDTKAGRAASNALFHLETGDIEKALSFLKEAENNLGRIGEKKKEAFGSTGFTLKGALETVIKELGTTDSELSAVNDKTKLFQQVLANVQAGQLQEARHLLDQMGSGFEKNAASAREAAKAAQDYAQSTVSMKDQVKQLQQSTQYFFSLRNMINLFKRGVREAVDTVKQLDAAMTETAVVTNFSVGDMWAKLPEYTANANALGATVQDMYESTTLYYQQGLDTQQAMGIAAETMKMARIAGLEAAEATDMMTAALRGFNMELNETSATRINDVYSNLAAKTASDTEELGTAMQRTASIAHSAGMSFEGTAAFLAQAIETTREPAENIGTAMKTIVARFQEMKKNPLEISDVEGEEVSFNKVDAALKTIGVDLKDTNGQFRELDKVFLDISQKWDGLSQTQQRYIATIAAGSRQQSRFIAMMSDYDRTMELMGYANNSAGASTTQFNKTLDSLEAKINKFQNAWKQFLMGIMNDSWTKKVVDAGTSVLNVVNKIIDTLSAGGRLKGVKSLLSTFTAFTALKMTGRGANALIGGLGGMVDPQSSFRAGAQSGAIGRNSAQAINQPIVKELQSIRSLIAQKINTNDLAKSNINGPYDEYNRLKEARTGISQMKGRGTIGELTKQFSGLSGSSQNLLMSSNAGTFRSAIDAIINSYGSKNRAAVRKGERWLDNERKSARLTAEEYFTALQDPGLLKDAMLRAGIQKNNPAYEYMKGLDDAVTTRASELRASARKTALKQANEKDYDRINELFNSDKVKEKYRKLALKEQEENNQLPGSQTKFERSNWGKALDGIGKIGSGISQAGMGIQAFGSILTSSANPALQMFGSALTSVGGLISGLGMGISGLAAGFTALASSSAMEAVASAVVTAAKRFEAASSLTVAGAATAITGILFGLVAVIAGVAWAIKKHNDNIKKAAEETTKNYKDKSSENQSNIANLKQWKSELAVLSKGVDENGYNISLDPSDYEHYLEIVDGIAKMNPEIVQGYNAQGHAIIDNNKALEKTLSLEEQRSKNILRDYTNTDSLTKLLKARNLERTHYAGGGAGDNYIETIEYELKPRTDMRHEMSKIGSELRRNKDLIDLSKLDIDIDALARGEEAEFQKVLNNYDTFKRLVSESIDRAGDEWGDKSREAIEKSLSSFEEYGADLDELIQPTYEALSAAASQTGSFQEMADNLKVPFQNALKELATNGEFADGKEIDKAAKNMATKFAGYSEAYIDAMDKVDRANKQFSLDFDEGNYKELTEDAISELEALKATLEDTPEGHAISEWIDSEIHKIQNHLSTGTKSIEEAWDTISDKVAVAESSLDTFNKKTEKDFYSAADDMQKIYETVMDPDAYHTIGFGDNTFWAGAESLLGQNNIMDKTKDEVLGMMKAIEPFLKEGPEGIQNFANKVEELSPKLEEIAGVEMEDGWFKSIDENINPEAWAQIAEYMGISEELLISMVNKSRQFKQWDFSDMPAVREAYSIDETVIHGKKQSNVTTTDETGKETTVQADTLYITDAELRSRMGSDYYQKDKRENKTEELKKQGIEVLPEHLNQLTAQMMKNEMGIANWNEAIKTFGDTGIFDKSEIYDAAKTLAESEAKEKGEEFNEDVFREQFNEGWTTWLENYEDPLVNPVTTMAGDVAAIAGKIVGESSADKKDKSESSTEKPSNNQDNSSAYTSRTNSGTTIPGVGFVPNKTPTQNSNPYTPEQEKTYSDNHFFADLFNNLGNKITESAQKQQEVQEAYKNIQGQNAEELKQSNKDFFSKIGDALNTSINDKTGYTNESESTSNNQTSDNLNAGSESLAEAASQLTGGLESLSVAGESLNAAASNLTTAAAIIVSNSGNNNTSNNSGTVPNVPQTAQSNQSSVSGAIVVDNTQALANLDAVYQKATETAGKINEGATFTISTPGLSNLTKAASSAQKIADSAGPKDISLNTSISGASSENIDNLKKSVKGFNSLGSHSVNLTTNLKGASVSSIESIVAAINAFHLKTDHTVTLKTVKETVNNGDATGAHNHGSFSIPSFNSAAGGYGQIGPKGKGGLTLTGELGYEVAWLPSENRSMILGANGPQMVNLPGDAVVWTHEQSKKILKQKAIPAGSQATATSSGGWNFSGYGNSGGGSTSSSKTVTDAAHRVTRAAETAAVKVGKVSVWWENIARTTEGIQRKADKAYSQFEKYIKSMQATLKTTGTTGQGNAYISNMSKVIGKNEAQYKKASEELQSLDTKGRTKIKWKQGKKNKSKKENLGDYIDYDSESDSYVINQEKINSVATSKKNGGKAKAKAIKEAAEQKINEKQSKRNKAEDEIKKAQEALDKFGQELYNTFFKWEVELTKIWNLTKQIEATEKNISRAKTFQETLDKQLSTGRAKHDDPGFAQKSMAAFNAGLSESVNKIHTQMDLVEKQKEALQKTLSIEDEKTTLAAVQAKLNQRAVLDKTAEQKKTALNQAQAKLNDAKQRQAAKEQTIKDLKKKKKNASKSKKSKIQKQIDAAEKELKNIKSEVDTYSQQVNSANAAYQSALTAATNNLNDTEKIGYENYRDALQEQIKAQTEAKKYLTITQNGDGTVSVDFNTEKFEAEKLKGNITEEQGKAIQDYVKEITDNSAALSDAYQSANASINELYDELAQLQNQWAEYANELWDIHDKETKERINNLKTLSDSINKALKKLLDDIKRKLDERRQQEDNRKTELDISQKQQRLAMLRADTSGGHQVEIAQLQKEIAEAQQNYQRSLEDQLLDKLQQQADLAVEQRERQIELEEEIIEGVNNAALVDMWMENPEQFEDDIYEAFKKANDYDKKPKALQQQLDTKFEELMDGLTNNQKKQEAVNEAIDSIEDTVDKIRLSLALMTANISTAKDVGLTVKEAHEYLEASYKDLGDPNKGKYTIQDFIDEGISYEDAKQAFAPDKLKEYEFYKEAATKDIIDTAKLNLDKAWKAYYYSNQHTVDNYNKALATAQQLRIDTSQYDVAKLIAEQKSKEETERATQAAIDAILASLHSLTNSLTFSARTQASQITAIGVRYATGGLADFNGPAWLDGTPSKPELVLNPQDTQNFLALRDVLSKAIGSTNSIDNTYGGDNIFEINVNVDKIEKDYDVDRVIEKVKKEITKGAGYRNVTQVRNFR